LMNQPVAREKRKRAAITLKKQQLAHGQPERELLRNKRRDDIAVQLDWHCWIFIVVERVKCAQKSKSESCLEMSYSRLEINISSVGQT
jgi:hypothetical protein